MTGLYAPSIIFYFEIDIIYMDKNRSKISVRFV